MKAARMGEDGYFHPDIAIGLGEKEVALKIY